MTATLSKVNEGDLIRVVIEAEVEYAEDGYFEASGGSLALYTQDKSIKSIEVLPRPVRVGDTIEGNAAYDKLPNGAVCASEYETVVKVGDRWFDRDGEPFDPFSPRTLKYLPE